MLATVRNKGISPCPRCTIRLDRVHNLGMKNDRKHRITKARVDNDKRRSKIVEARKAIYVDNLPVNSGPVEKSLKDESYVPTRVCFPLISIWMCVYLSLCLW